MEHKGRIICNAKNDQVVVTNFWLKNTSDTLKNIRRRRRRRNSTAADRFSTAAAPHKFDAARRRNSTAPGSIRMAFL